jgi:hypothetical protein
MFPFSFHLTAWKPRGGGCHTCFFDFAPSHTALSFILRILLWCLPSTPSPIVPNFTMPHLLWRLFPLSAFYRAYIHSAYSPTELKEWRRRGNENAILKRSWQSLKKYLINIILLLLKNTLEILLGLACKIKCIVHIRRRRRRNSASTLSHTRTGWRKLWLRWRRWEIIVRGQSYGWRLPKYWPPTPLTAQRVCTPAFGAGEDTLAGWRGGGGSIFWKTQDTALYSTYVSTLLLALSAFWTTLRTRLRRGSIASTLLLPPAALRIHHVIPLASI